MTEHRILDGAAQSLLRQVKLGEENSLGPIKGSVVSEAMPGAGCQMDTAEKLEAAGLVRIIKDPDVPHLRIAQLTDVGRSVLGFLESAA